MSSCIFHVYIWHVRLDCRSGGVAFGYKAKHIGSVYTAIPASFLLLARAHSAEYLVYTKPHGEPATYSTLLYSTP